MRWLLVSSQHHPTHGGIGTYVTRFVEAAIRSGWSIDLVTRPSRLLPSGARVHEVSTADMEPDFASRVDSLRHLERIRPYRYALWSRAVAGRLLEMPADFDVIEFVDCQAEGFASIGSEQVRRHFRGIPMIVHAHTPMFIEEDINGCDSTRFGRHIYHDWERRALQTCDGIMVTSHLLAQRMPVEVPHTIIPYPVAGQQEPGSNKQRQNMILFVGSIQPRKGVDTWVRSLNEVMCRNRDITAMMIGPDTATGPRGTSMVEHLKALLDVEHSERLQWLGAQPHEQVMSQIASASLVVVPSVFESFSFAAAEAIGRGTPVLVSDQVGIAEHVQGLPRCPAGDVRAWAEAQLRIVEDQSQARREVRSLKTRMLEACSPSRHLQLRERFVRAIHAARPDGMQVRCSGDALEELNEFIAGVENAERSIGMASSA